MQHPHRLPSLTISAWMRFDEIRRGLTTAHPRNVLEIGAGQGGLGAWIAQRYDYVGFEPDTESRAVAVGRVESNAGGRVISDLDGTLTEKFDLACAFEVLEHIEDDANALDEWHRLIAPRGYLLISVPAHSARYGTSDSYVGHFRRYDGPQLRALLEEHGFSVLQSSSYGFGLGHLLDATRNAVLRRRPQVPSTEEGTAMSGRLFQPGRTTQAILNYLVAAPFRVLQLPFARTDAGIGYVVLAQRTS
jgi:SAM-dependent methyltransferase